MSLYKAAFFWFFCTVSCGAFLILANQYPLVTLVNHIFIHIVVFLCVFFTLSLVYNNNNRISRVASAIVVWLYFCLVVSLYVINLVSNYAWGSSVNFQFILSLPMQVVSMLKGMSLSVPLFGMFILMLFLSLYFLSFLFVNKVLAREEFVQLRKSKKLYLYSGLYLFFFAFYFSISFSRELPSTWSGEPYSSLLNKQHRFLTQEKAREAVVKDLLMKNKYLESIDVGQVRKKNIILFIGDSLRSDRMSVYGYGRETTPGLESLRDEYSSLTVDYGVSTCSESACGILSILSSRTVDEIGTGIFQITDLLKDIGYKNHFILSSDHSLNGLKDTYSSLDYYWDGSDSYPDFLSNDDRGIVSALQRNHYDVNENHFFYFHLMSPHAVGTLDEAHLEWAREEPFDEPYLESIFRDKIPYDRINKYDARIRQTDSLILNILDILRVKGLLKDALVVVTGDHGEGFGEHGRFGHTYYLHNEDIRIPIIFVDTNAVGGSLNVEFARQIDIAPTMLGAMNIIPPSTWKGVNLYDETNVVVDSYHQTLRNNGVYAHYYKHENNIYKLIIEESADGYSKLLYDVNSDPYEELNLSEQFPNIRDLMFDNLIRNFELAVID